MVDLQRLRDWPGIPRRADIVRGIVATHAANYNQTHWRFRAGDTDSLNGTTDWAAGEDTVATIGRGEAFRLRVKVTETNGDGTNNQDMHLQCRLNGGTWVSLTTQARKAALSGGLLPSTVTPVMVVESDQYADEDATTELLSNDGGPFVGGEGDEWVDGAGNAVQTSISNEETEFEFVLQIQSTHDDPSVAEVVDGDTIEFRMVEGTVGSATAFTGTYVLAELTVADTSGYIGGTYGESPNRTTHEDGNGNLYYVGEVAEPNPIITVRKSTDGGVTWRAMDLGGANEPVESDLEGVDCFLENDRLYIIQANGSDELYHHVFRVSTHGTNPDTWEVGDEAVTTGIVSANPQTCALVRRTNGDLIAFYSKGDPDNGCFYKIKTGASWGSEQTLDDEAATRLVGVAAVMDKANDTAHIVYGMAEDTVSHDIYHRSLDSNDNLSARELVRTSGTSDGHAGVTPPVYYDDAGDATVAFVVWDDDDKNLYLYHVVNDGSPSLIASAPNDNTVGADVGSGEYVPNAQLLLDGTDYHLIYADETTFDLWHDVSTDGGSTWGTDTEVLDGASVAWLRGAVWTKPDSDVVAACLYDEQIDGGTGQVRYTEHFIRTADTGQTFTQSVAGSVGFAGAMTRKTSKALAGAVSPAGAMTRQTSKQLAGAAGFSGLLSRVTSKQVAGSLSSSGALSSLPKKLVAGALSPSGALTFLPQKLLSGSLSPSATLSRKTSTSIAGSVGFSGLLSRITKVTPSGSLDFVGSLSTKQVVTQLVTGALSFTGSLVRTTKKQLAGAVSPSGTLVGEAKKLLTGSLSFVGTVVTAPKKLLSGALSFTGSLTTQQVIQQTVSGAVSFTGDLIRTTKKQLAGAISPSGTLVGLAKKRLSGVLSFAGALLKQTKTTVQGSVSFAGSLATQLVTAVQQLVTGQISPTGDVSVKVSKVLSGAVSFGGSLLTTAKRVVTGQISPSGTLSGVKTVFQNVAGAVDFSGALGTVLETGGAVIRNLIDFLRITDIDDPEG